MDTGELQGQHVVLGNVLSEIKTKVMYRLIEDEALCKLLYYDTPDALDHDITTKQIQELILQKSTNKQRPDFSQSLSQSGYIGQGLRNPHPFPAYRRGTTAVQIPA